MVKIRDDLPKTPDGGIDIEKWIERISINHNASEKALFKTAAYLCIENGGYHLTPANESCLKQGLIIVEILNTLNPDMPTLIAGMLLCVHEFGELKADRIQETFTPEIAQLVQGVSQLSIHSAKALTQKDHTQRDNLRRMLLAVVEDVRVVLIKLAERISALRAAPNIDQDERVSLALEARDIYAPLANRLGMGQIKWELEDLAFRYLEPMAYKNIANLLDEKRLDREIYIEKALALIKSAIKKEGIEAEVTGRVKHIYSIWRKMIRKDLAFKEIYDVRAVRVLVNSIHDCYAVLGIIHALWQYIPKEFDDYIATPKENGYRSLHTAVIGPEGKTLEIQIRTYQMHDEAELGVAAHWVYKEGKKHDTKYQKRLNALRNILEWSADEEAEANDALKQALSEERVFVFTPQGKIVDLPLGSTPLDFAYHVHTELGHRCRGAKINGMIKPLNYRLNSGEQVDIIASKTGGPSRDWLTPQLGYLLSARARAKVRTWFKQLDKEEHTDQGRTYVERELKRLDLDISELKPLLKQLNFQKLDELYAGVGNGDLRMSQILHLLQKSTLDKEGEATAKLLKGKVSQQKPTEVSIKGVTNLLCHFARCCNPVPGDPIIGYITVGRGVTIHRMDCLHVLDKEEESQRLIEVDWGELTREFYPVEINIEAYDRQGLLRDITAILSNDRINVTSVNTQTNPDNNIAYMKLSIQIPDLDVLMNVLNKILQLPNVLNAHRVGGKKGE